MVLVQVREFECIFSQVEIIPQKQHQIAHELLIMKDSFLQHIKDNLLGGKVDLRRLRGKLLHNIIRKSVEGADLSRNSQALIDSLPQLSNRLVGVGDHDNLAGVDVLFIHQILYLRGHGRRLSRTGASHQKAVVVICDHRAALFLIQLYLWVDLF